MAANKVTKRQIGGRRPPDDPEPALQYKHRGIYETERFTAPRILFVVTRLACTMLTYSILVNRDSWWSIFRLMPSAEALYPSKPPSISPDQLRLPFVSTEFAEYISSSLDMPITSALVYLMFLGVGIQFCTYTLLWRRELFPMTGDGSAITTTLAATIIDMVYNLIFFYFSERNPTWTVSMFRWMPIAFFIGLPIQFAADHQKHLFKENPKNKNEVLQSGLWGLVRAPNYTGFMIWRVAQSFACLGWVGGLFFGYANLQAYRDASIPSIEQHMSRKYGPKFDAYKKRVPRKLIPGIY